MKRVIALLLVTIGVVGCATPQQNAALAGAVVGAAVMTSIHNSQQPPTRVVTCSYVRGGYVGRDQYGQPMFRYHKVCN